MKKTILLLFASVIWAFNSSFAQYYIQDFDGDDTSRNNSIIIHLDTSRQNIWQIGAPHKHYFDSAYSRPNVIVTDTSIPYPANNTSIFSFAIPIVFHSIYVAQWVQKLDMDSGHDGGIVEFSMDTGRTWYNGFNSPPYVYNFYGYNTSNKMVLPSGDTAFSGTDSVWRNVWICFNTLAMPPIDSLYVRFRFISDSVNHNREGWMIDNMEANLEVIHPVRQVNKDAYMMVYPRLTNGLIYINAKYKGAGFKIETAQLINNLGQIVQQYKIGSNDSYINIAPLAGGWYTLRVFTNMVTESYRIWLKKN